MSENTSSRVYDILSILFFHAILEIKISSFSGKSQIHRHCCYQRPFQEVNIPMNRALLPNCKIESTCLPFLIFFLKTELLKKCYDKLVLPEMPGGIIYKKKFFVWSIFVSKNGYFFLKLPFFTTKWPEGLPVFGPELPTGVMKIDF